MARTSIPSMFVSGILAAAAAILPAACFDRPTPACALWCGIGGACPDGYRCTADEWCKREDVPEDHECGPGPNQDASPADAPLADASPDAPPDAPADALPGPPPDALGDAMPPDASIDAALPDANGAGLR